METPEFLIALVLAVAGGATGAAFINLVGDRLKFRADRKAKKEDKKAEADDKTAELGKTVSEIREIEMRHSQEYTQHFQQIDLTLLALQEGLKLIMLDRIIHLGQKYIDDGEITFEDRKRLRDMHDCYHNRLGGNGDANLIMGAVDELPLKKV